MSWGDHTALQTLIAYERTHLLSVRVAWGWWETHRDRELMGAKESLEEYRERWRSNGYAAVFEAGRAKGRARLLRVCGQPHQ